MKTTIRKRSLLVASILLLSLIPLSQFTQGALGTQPYFMAGRQFLSDYFLYPDGGSYYAKNAFGLVEYSSTNYTFVAQSVFDLVDDNGGGWVAYGSGLFLDGVGVNLPHNLRVTGAGMTNTIVRATANITLFSNKYTSLTNGIEISHLTLDGNDAIAYNVTGISFRGADGVGDGGEDSFIHHIHFTEISYCAIYLENCYKVNINNIDLFGWDDVSSPTPDPCLYGIYLDSCGGINIVNNQLFYCTYVIFLDGGYQIQVVSNSIYYYNDSAVFVGTDGIQQLKVNSNKMRGYYFGGQNSKHAINGYRTDNVSRIFMSEILGNTVDYTTEEAFYFNELQQSDVSHNNFYACAYDPTETFSIINFSGSVGFNGVHNTFADNTFYTSGYDGEPYSYIYGYAENTTYMGFNSIHDNHCVGVTTVAPIIEIGPQNEIYKNWGFKTRNTGNATGTTGMTVTHGLHSTLTPNFIAITPNENAGNFYYSDVGSTTFKINFDGGGTIDFSFVAEYQYP